MLLVLDLLFKLALILSIATLLGIALAAQAEKQKFAKANASLVAVAQRAKLEGAKLALEVLRSYVDHDITCPYGSTRDANCTCGLSAAIDAVTEMQV